MTPPLPHWLRDHWLLGATAAVVLVLFATVGAHVLLWASIPHRGHGAAFSIIEIPEGTGAARAVQILVEHGIVQRSPLALLYLRLTGRTRGIKAGEYYFTRPMTPGEVFDKIISGDVYYHRVTIPEGVRSGEVFAEFIRAGFGTEQEYRDLFRDVSLIADLDPLGHSERSHPFLELGRFARTYADMIQPEGLREIRSYARGIGVHKNLVLPRDSGDRLLPPTALVRDAHAAGLLVHVYTLRAENQFLPAELRRGPSLLATGDVAGEADLFLKAGVDGFFIDQPAAGVAARNGFLRRPRP